MPRPADLDGYRRTGGRLPAKGETLASLRVQRGGIVSRAEMYDSGSRTYVAATRGVAVLTLWRCRSGILRLIWAPTIGLLR